MSFIAPAPVRVGEDLPPPSWDRVPYPRVDMFGRGSPRLTMMLSKAQKKNSPKATPSKKQASSPKEKLRASWNPVLEKTLVDLLHEHKSPDYRGQNGWTSEAWNKIVKEFHEREDYVSFTKAQIQEKEKELKREYRMLKEARKQSGAHWDDKLFRIIAEAPIWNNIIHSHPKAKKFRNKSFPLFDALGELYDGHTAEGTYNFTSTQTHAIQVDSADELSNNEVMYIEEETLLADHERQESDNGRVHEVEEESASIERNDQRPQKRVAAVTRNKEENEPKRQRRNGNLEELMGRYLDMRTKQAEEEAAHLARESEERIAREKEASQVDDFSIKRCISVLKTMELTKEEKAKAYGIFKDPDNRQIFLSACDGDQESALIWLRNEMA